MKILSLILLVLMTSSVLASSYTFKYGGDMRLTFEGKAKETICKNWFAYTPVTLDVSDKWSRKGTTTWKVSNMKYNEPSGLTFTYPLMLSKGSNNNQVCITSKYRGEYRGMLFLDDNSQTGNQRIRMGIWVKVLVK